MCRCVCVGEKGEKEKKRVDKGKKRRKKGEKREDGVGWGEGGEIERKIHNMLMHECPTIKLDKYVPEDIQAFPRLCILSQLLNQCSSQGEPSEVAAQISIHCSQILQAGTFTSHQLTISIFTAKKIGRGFALPCSRLPLSLK